LQFVVAFYAIHTGTGGSQVLQDLEEEALRFLRCPNPCGSRSRYLNITMFSETNLQYLITDERLVYFHTYNLTMIQRF
jgi:hypothetical protein